MQVEWYGQSAFRLPDGATTVFIDPCDDLTALAERLESSAFDHDALPSGDGPLVVVPAAP